MLRFADYVSWRAIVGDKLMALHKEEILTLHTCAMGGQRCWEVELIHDVAAMLTLRCFTPFVILP